MKSKSSGADAGDKIIVVCTENVSESVKENIRKRYPHSFIKAVKPGDLLNESIVYQAKVKLIIFLPEAKTDDNIVRARTYWQGTPIEIYQPKEENDSRTTPNVKKAV